MKPNLGYYGDPERHFEVKDLSTCQEECNKDSHCIAWTYGADHKDKHKCTLWKNVNKYMLSTGIYVSGPKNCGEGMK